MFVNQFMLINSMLCRFSRIILCKRRMINSRVKGENKKPSFSGLSLQFNLCALFPRNLTLSLFVSPSKTNALHSLVTSLVSHSLSLPHDPLTLSRKQKFIFPTTNSPIIKTNNNSHSLLRSAAKHFILSTNTTDHIAWNDRLPLTPDNE